jgi:hypothetical protein
MIFDFFFCYAVADSDCWCKTRPGTCSKVIESNTNNAFHQPASECTQRIYIAFFHATYWLTVYKPTSIRDRAGGKEGAEEK